MATAGLIVAIAAAVLAYLSWRASQEANRISGESNTLARRALGISEAEHEQRELERKARARLRVDVGVVDRDPDEQGVIRLGGTSGNLRLRIAVRNDGDRDAGRGKVEATFPLTASDLSIQ